MIFNGCNTVKNLILVEQGSANFFCNGPHIKYFQFCRADGICYSYSTLPLQSKTATDNKQWE